MLVTKELNGIFDQFNQFIVLFVSDVHDSENVGETSVSCFSHSTFLEHIVADIAEDLKLLNASQGVGTVTIFHDFEHVCFGSDHQFRGEMS